MSVETNLATLVLTAAKAKALKKVIFSRPVAGDNAPSQHLVRAAGTLCLVGGQTVLQIEGFQRDNKAKHKNLPLDGTLTGEIATLATAFSQVNVLTVCGDAEYRRSKKGNAVLLGAEKLSLRLTAGVAPDAAVAVGGNNREKNYILSGAEPFLFRLGVADKNGRVFDKKRAKFRQINRFLELVRDTLPYLPPRGSRIGISDLCCGKSYLSFAAYHYFKNVLGYTVDMVGVDLKEDVVALCNEVAGDLGFTGLRFFAGNVAAFTPDFPVHLVISLHACDTATDLVLERAVAYGAAVILATPCCHHELNHTLSCPTLSFIAEHSMLRQKLCDAATDALRLKHLESLGFEVAALELIDPEETPKNVMLRACRKKGEPTAHEKERAERAAREYETARKFLLGK